jgi:ribosomal protein L14E/L6E/L27E
MPALTLNTNVCIRQARKSIHPARPRPSLQPGTVVILLAGRFRGKRVILLKHLSEGTLLITGPFKINGVPLRRVNSRYVIATNTKIDLKGVEDKTLEKISEANYFTKEKKSEKAKTEEAFFKQGEKPEVERWLTIIEVLANLLHRRRNRRAPEQQTKNQSTNLCYQRSRTKNS